MTPDDFERLWRHTPVPMERQETAVCATGVEIAGFDVVVAHDSIGRRHFLVPFGPDENIRASHRGAAMRAIAPRPLVREGISHDYLDVVCTRPELHGIFCRLATELLAVASGTPERPATRCEETLRLWRDLFGSRSAGLGPEQVVGLLGELVVLERLAKFDPARAVSCWTGPLGGIHDFRRGASALEVKSTTRHHGRFFKVNGIDQLAEPSGGRLAVAALQFERVPEGTISITSLLSRIRALNADANLIRERLEEIGYSEGRNLEVDAETFELRDSRLYVVGPEFPRIVHATFVRGLIPRGVTAIEYEIDLTSTPPHPLESGPDEVWLRDFIQV